MSRQRSIAMVPDWRPWVFLAALALGACLAATAHAATGGDPAAQFIQTLGSQGFAVIRSTASYGQKSAYFLQVLRQDFDLTSVARFALGPYCRCAALALRQ